jgi:putative lipoprotein
VLIGVFAASIAGCDSPLTLPNVASRAKEPAPVVAPSQITSARYACNELVLLVALFPDHLVLAEPEGGELILQPAPSTEGVYINGDRIFWIRGRGEATLERDGEILPCRELPDPWKHAGDRGVDFRAVGQEPGWFLEIDEARLIHIVYDYAERELTTTSPVKIAAPGRTTYTAVAGEQQVTVVVEEKACADAMSGEPFPLAVTLTIDDRELDGCGRPVVQLAR